MGTKRNETLLNIHWHQNANPKKKKKRVHDDDSDTDSDNEIFMKNETNWPRILIIESASEDLLLQKLGPFAIQKGFQSIAGTLKIIKRLRNGSFLWSAAKGPRPKT